MKRPEAKIRFDTRIQKEKIVRAAKLRRWSLNTFVVEAADKAADKLVGTSNSSEQLTEPSKQPALNQ